MWPNLKFLIYYTAESEDFLQWIVRGDESRVHYWTPRTKKASMMQNTAEKSTPLKFKEHPSAEKIMAAVLRYWYSLLLLKFYLQKMSVISSSYFDTLKLQMVIKKNSRLLSQWITLHCDNVSSHTAGLTQTLVKKYEVENFEAFAIFSGSHSVVGFSHLLFIER